MFKKYLNFSRIVSIIFLFIFFAASCFVIYIGVNSKKATNSYTETATATIVSINNDAVKVSFEFNNQTYITTLDFYSSNMQIGDTKTIHFDADNPTDISSDTFVNAFIIAGSVFCVISAGALILTIIRWKAHNKSMSEKEKYFDNIGTISNAYESKYDFSETGSDATYYFTPGGKGRRGFLMCDENKEVVYEAKLLKNRVFKPSEFEFINYKRGIKKSHTVGMCVTTSSNGFVNKSSFKFDGIGIWTRIDEMGICFKTNVKNLVGLEFEVAFNNRHIGKIVTTGSDVYGESTRKLSHIPVRGFYKITTKEEYIDQMFLLAFALSRTETVYQDI